MAWKLSPKRSEETADSPEKAGVFQRLKNSLGKTGKHLVGRLRTALTRRNIDEDLFAELERILITSDVGVKASAKILSTLKEKAGRLGISEASDLEVLLKEEILKILQCAPERVTAAGSPSPLVVLFVGVNGVGKTTSLGKLAHMFSNDGKKVMLVAADTFRAAAAEQLEIWGQRTGAEVIKNPQGRDPSAVLFDALKAAKSRGTEIVLVDTAGRLHTKVNLMEELTKLARVAAKEVSGAPQEVLLVVDASTGQNALQQAKIFHGSMKPTGIILTKLDGTAKGGVIIGIYEELGIPVRFVGVGEGEADLEEFDAAQFVDAMFYAGSPVSQTPPL